MPYKDKSKITQTEKKLWQIYLKKENEKLRKNHVRISEKIKEIRHYFSKVVTTGTWTGSGKIIFKHYDMLIQIWFGSTSTKPLSLGLAAESFSKKQEPSTNKSNFIISNFLIINISITIFNLIK